MKRNSKGRRILPAFFLFGFCAVLFSTLSLASLIAPKNMASALKSSRRIRVRLAEVMPKVLLRGFDLRIGDKTYGKLTEWEFRCQDGAIVPLYNEPEDENVLRIAKGCNKPEYDNVYETHRE